MVREIQGHLSAAVCPGVPTMNKRNSLAGGVSSAASLIHHCAETLLASARRQAIDDRLLLGSCKPKALLNGETIRLDGALRMTPR